MRKKHCSLFLAHHLSRVSCAHRLAHAIAALGASTEHVLCEVCSVCVNGIVVRPILPFAPALLLLQNIICVTLFKAECRMLQLRAPVSTTNLQGMSQVATCHKIA